MKLSTETKGQIREILQECGATKSVQFPFKDGRQYLKVSFFEAVGFGDYNELVKRLYDEFELQYELKDVSDDSRSFSGRLHDTMPPNEPGLTLDEAEECQCSMCVADREDDAFFHQDDLEPSLVEDIILPSPDIPAGTNCPCVFCVAARELETAIAEIAEDEFEAEEECDCFFCQQERGIFGASEIVPKLTGWQARLIEQHDDLHARTISAFEFIQSPEFDELDQEAAFLLVRQIKTMAQLGWDMANRIEYYGLGSYSNAKTILPTLSIS